MRAQSFPAITFALCLAALITSLAGGAYCQDDSSQAAGRIRLDQFPDPDQYEVGSRMWLKASEALSRRPLVAEGLAERCPHSFDVLNYYVIMKIDTDAATIWGNTTVTSTSEQAGLDSITLDFTVLTVDSVLGAAGPLGYSYDDPVLSIGLGESYEPGDTFFVRVVYHGTPGNEGSGGFGGFWFDGVPTMGYQMGVGLYADPPSMGKYWVPCWDWPCDKATADYRITVVGSGKKVVCNGVLTETVIDTEANTATYVWSETHQIPPHLMTVHARRFTELVDSTYSWIHYWVFPADAEDAAIHFQNVDVMMDAFVSRYGPYPFSKFGYVAATKGDMEHQTCVTHNRMTIQPNRSYDWLLAHEMSHQWWGDCVSVNDWRDIWLSEGFATYSEAIFEEYAYGTAAYRDYVANSLMRPVLHMSENFPIYDPNNLWGTTVYEKGACVLHMLRHVVGDSLFFAALAAHRTAHEYSSAVTSEFQDTVESVSGRDLDWFFDEWIYDVGWPVYEYSWNAAEQGGAPGTYALALAIDQVQTNGPVFTMPVDLKIVTAGGDTAVTVVDSTGHQSFDLVVASEPIAVELDPDNWILDEAEEVPYAGVDGQGDAGREAGLALEQNKPNPFGPATTIRYSVPRGMHVRLSIYDAAGRRVVNLLDGELRDGSGQVMWDARDASGRNVAAGTYFCRLTTECGGRTIPLVVVR
jgi:aminopeptidase N